MITAKSYDICHDTFIYGPNCYLKPNTTIIPTIALSDFKI